MNADSALILVVEDEDELRDLLVSEIEAAGMRALSAENGRVGYEKVLAERPDLVLCDVVMPEMCGFDFLWRIRNEHPEFNMMPVMFLTGLGETSDKIAALGLGVDDYIAKPFDFSLLIPQIWGRLNQIKRIAIGHPDVSSGSSGDATAGPSSTDGDAPVAAVCSKNHENVRHVAEVLRQQGFSTFETMSGEDLLSALPEKSPDIVFLSYLTRDVAGFYLANRIKQIAKNGVRVILIGDPAFPALAEQLPDVFDDLIYPASAAEDIHRIQATV